MSKTYGMNRRGVLKAGLAFAAAAPGLGLVLTPGARAAGKVVIQYDWLMSNGQIGDIAAVANGYFKDAGLEPATMATADFEAYVRRDSALWAGVIQKANIQLPG